MGNLGGNAGSGMGIQGFWVRMRGMGECEEWGGDAGNQGGNARP